MVLNFAVITDIHGNYPALQAVLRDLDTLDPQINHIYCLGDMIGIGPHSNEVLAELWNRPNVSMLTGNHDEVIIALLNNEPYPQSHLHEQKHHLWIAESVKPAFIPLLKSLPKEREAQIGSEHVFMTHFHRVKDVHISENPFASIGKHHPVPLESVKRLFQDSYQADLVLFGHIHDSCKFTLEKTRFVNPGALGCNSQPYARYAIITFNEQKIAVQMKQTWYDKQAFVNEVKRIKYPEYRKILQIFYGSCD